METTKKQTATTKDTIANKCYKCVVKYKGIGTQFMGIPIDDCIELLKTKSFIQEQCPYCDNLVDLPPYMGIYECPECGELIVACSLCDMDSVNCDGCKYVIAKDQRRKCIECESEINLKYADLHIEHEEAKKYIELLENCLDMKEQLNETLRKKRDELYNKLSIYGE